MASVDVDWCSSQSSGMSGKVINHGFMAEQWAWLSAPFSVVHPNTGFGNATINWKIGGLTALGLVAVAFLCSEIGSVRAEVRQHRAEIGSVRDQA